MHKDKVKILEMLKQSPITPGDYIPTPEFIRANHAAVFVHLTPVLLTGWAEDPASVPDV